MIQVEADVAARRVVAVGTAPQVLEEAADDVHPWFVAQVRFAVLILSFIAPCCCSSLLSHAGAAQKRASAAAVQCRAAPQGLSMLVRASAVDHGCSFALL